MTLTTNTTTFNNNSNHSETQALLSSSSNITDNINSTQTNFSTKKDYINYEIIVSLRNTGSSLKRLRAPINPYKLKFVLDRNDVEDLFVSFKEVSLYTNYPINNKEFDRFSFTKLTEEENIDLSIGEITVKTSGIYEYYVMINSTKSNVNYFMVDPILAPIDNDNIEIEELNMITIIPHLIKVNKNKNYKDEWTNLFINSIKYNNGYNIVHFSPIQKMGQSKSPYSIQNQLEIDDSITNDNKENEKELYHVIKQSRNAGVMSICDLVLNHTANTSIWLKEHPESAYNLKNSKHLKSAYLIDCLLKDISIEIMNNNAREYSIDSEEELNLIMDKVKDKLNKVELFKYIVLDVDKEVNMMNNYIQDNNENSLEDNNKEEKSVDQLVEIINRNRKIYFETYNQSEKQMNVKQVYRLLFNDKNKDNKEKILNLYKNVINILNVDLYKEYNDVYNSIIENSRNYLKYQRMDNDGPRTKVLNENCMLFPKYFTNLLENNTSIKEEDKDEYIVANNGWIWNNPDPTLDFASEISSVYLKREVVCWEDCVKLNYTQNKEGSYLVEYMKKYTREIALNFDGIRIDNCHSTPLELAIYLIDYARKINKNLLVVAELFTGSMDMDFRFVTKLGINLLIREAMQCNTPFELSRLTYMYGGAISSPAGSLVLNEKIMRDAYPPALFMDCTHDNETPYRKRSIKDTLPNAAIVCFGDCAVGSVKGYDELYPLHIKFGEESLSRKYAEYNPKKGIIGIKRKLLELHSYMHKNKYTESYVHHENGIVAVHRQNPKNHDGYLLIASTAFDNNNDKQTTSPIKMENTKVNVIFGASMSIKSNLNNLQDEVDKIVQNNIKKGEYRGIDDLVEVREHDINIEEFTYSENNKLIVDVNKLSWFNKGSILVLKTDLNQDIEFMNKINTELNKIRNTILTSDKIDLLSLNVLLYRTDEEERDYLGHEHGAYVVSNYNNYKLIYCGLQGFISVLLKIKENNDLGHPICEHLRQGLWMYDYIVNRIKLYAQNEDFKSLNSLVENLEDITDILKLLPMHLRPKYFVHIVFQLYEYAIQKAQSLMSLFVTANKDIRNTQFVKNLAMCSVQLNGIVKSSGLEPFNNINNIKNYSLAAGLPHFATDFMRIWGRDVSISLTGLFMCTGQLEQAKKHIIKFASVVNHGLVPNLIDSLRNPRYNSRDSVWWFLQAIKNYCKITNSNQILREKVNRRHPQKIDTYVEFDSEHAFKESNTLSEIIHEIMEKHANGIKFREHKAGKQLDEHMLDEGFNIEINFDIETGFIYGGNLFNCGTWMDKMGEYKEKKGIPSTPRDGAAIEIIGLLKSTLNWLTEISNTQEFEFDNVYIRQLNRNLSFKDWRDLIQDNFERCFYVPDEDDINKQDYKTNNKLVNRTGIYKDLYKSKKEYTDYQFRPNFGVAMAVADEMFNKNHAIKALKLAKEVLVAPLGMKTLDPKDWEYRPNYDNANYSDDLSVAKGYNYHQGPVLLF